MQLNAAPRRAPIGSDAILSDCTHNLLDTAFLRTGVAFASKSESTLTPACLDGPLLAAVYGKPALGVVTYLTLNGH